jgi:hypothetical protein
MDHAPDAALKVRDGFKELQEMVDAGTSSSTFIYVLLLKL